MSARFYKYGRSSRGTASGLFIIVLLFLATAAGLAWVSMGIVASDRWPIRWLELNGAFQRVSAEQLRASLAQHIDSNFFTVDLQELDASASKISWVSTVHISKSWPDTVSVTIEEYVPVAHWNRGQLISEDGRIFSVPGAEEIQGLPWLQGPDVRLDDVLTHWADFNDLLLPLGMEIQHLRLDQRGSWSMGLSNGTAVKLGRSAAEGRLLRLLQSWDSLLQQKGRIPSEIDLRYTNGYAVQWPEGLNQQSGTGS